MRSSGEQRAERSLVLSSCLATWRFGDLLPTQRLQSISRLLNTAGQGLLVQIPRLCGITLSTKRSPRSEYRWIVRLSQRKRRGRASLLDSQLKKHSRCADIAL